MAFQVCWKKFTGELRRLVDKQCVWPLRYEKALAGKHLISACCKGVQVGCNFRPILSRIAWKAVLNWNADTGSF